MDSVSTGIGCVTCLSPSVDLLHLRLSPVHPSTGLTWPCCSWTLGGGPGRDCTDWCDVRHSAATLVPVLAELEPCAVVRVHLPVVLRFVVWFLDLPPLGAFGSAWLCFRLLREPWLKSASCKAAGMDFAWANRRVAGVITSRDQNASSLMAWARFASVYPCSGCVRSFRRILSNCSDRMCTSAVYTRSQHILPKRADSCRMCSA